MSMEGLPGGAELWKVGNKYYAVYKVPGTNVPLMFLFERGALLEAAGAGKPARTLTVAQARKLGAINFGVTSELDTQLGRHPWDSFLAKIKRDKDIAPWLNDPEVVAHVAAAWLRGVSPNLERTEWWQSKTDAERQWLERAASNPAQARQELADNRLRVVEELRQRGVSVGTNHNVARLIADSMTRGTWSEAYTNQQLQRLIDPHAPGSLDPALLRELSRMGASGDARAVKQGAGAVRDRVKAIFDNRGLDIATGDETERQRLDRITREVMSGQRDLTHVRRAVDRIAMQAGLAPGGFDMTRQHEDTVRDEWSRWLGPVATDGLSEAQVRQWAGQLRNDPNAMIRLQEHLQRQRLALFPEHENPDLTYEDIAAPWRGFVQQHWGMKADEMDPIFARLIRQNDAGSNLTLLRQEGIDRGVTQVMRDLSSDTLRAFGGQVRRAQ